jgi:hypothetical protein
MTIPLAPRISDTLPPITWEKLPADFVLPDEPGEVPAIVMEFISETEGGEYSINPHYPYGKWYFYERILQVPVYIIFQPQTGELEVYRLVAGKYELQKADENYRYWLAEIGLFLRVWQGKKAAVTAHWLRWWEQSGNLLLWGSERIEQERERAEQAERRAEGEKARADRLAAQLKAMGIELENE